MEDDKTQIDFIAIFASIGCEKVMDIVNANDSLECDVEIVEEVETCFDNHTCNLCCKGNFLVNKLLRFGGVINQSRRYGCDICCKGLWKKGDLLKHKMLHESGEINSDGEDNSTSNFDPFSNAAVCDYCQVSFKSSRGLTQHINRRHKENLCRTYTCEVCMETFQDMKKFTDHCSSHETAKKKTFQCFSCKKKFTYKKSLKAHVCTVK